MADYLKIFKNQADYDEYIESGYPKPNVSYIEDTDETIFTNYKDGEAGPEYILESAKIADFTGTTISGISKLVTGLNIPEGVTTLADSLLWGYTALTSVNFPSTLTTIGKSSFRGCSHLTSVDLSGTSMTYFFNGFGENAMTFYDCSALTDVVLPKALTGVQNQVFYSCSSLATINLEDTSVTRIGTSAFSGCYSLLDITLPSTVTKIDDSAFSWNIESGSKTTNLTVLATTPPTLGSNVFNNRDGINTTLNIYVPAESVEAYKAASGWSSYASSIQAIPA